ncbi:MAG: ABC transporter ATP-binding protein [Telmatospirillum sp.]|nr:ABC transporter ATP-binding protein [Telmatospirillum sp.]
MAHLVLTGLTKRYGQTVAVASLDLAVERGESVALLGPSGCGKTTTLRMLAGLIAPDAGRVTVADQDLTQVPTHKRDMGYVFQSYALFPHLDVAANVAFGLAERGIARSERDRRAREALALVRLAGFEGRRPRELSGGQQQRVALARALVLRPQVLLLDESLSNLDARLRESMRHEIREIQRNLAITTLFVTHDQTEALTMCDRIAVMNRGRIEQIGTAREIYDTPATRFVAGFVGRINTIPLARDATGLNAGGIAIRAHGVPDGPVDLFLRPQLVALAARSEPAGDANRLEGVAARTVFVGDRSEVLVDTAAGRLVVELAPGAPAPADGAEIALLWAPETGRVFAREDA